MESNLRQARQFYKLWESWLAPADDDRHATAQLEVPDPADWPQEGTARIEAGPVIAVDIGVNCRVPRVSQVAVDAMSGVGIDTHTSEFGHRPEVIYVNFLRL